jgi:hypothetical protein
LKSILGGGKPAHDDTWKKLLAQLDQNNDGKVNFNIIITIDRFTGRNLEMQ